MMIKTILPLMLALASSCVAVPASFPSASSVELRHVLERAVGDRCKASEGPGDCRSTSSCKGISYPANLCPKDPQDVQCCVEIKCKAPLGDHYCRSVSNNGCSGGTFNAGNHCPGSQDIQCCVKSTPSQTKCKAPYGNHDCRSVSKDGCSGGTFNPGNYCPGSQDIQCCVKDAPSQTKCRAPYGDSYCRSVSKDGCGVGTFNSGNYCPGSQDIQCCVKKNDGPPIKLPDLSSIRWPGCQKTLSCSFAQIAAASLPSRLTYLRNMQSNFFRPLNAADQFRPIEGVITFFIRNNLGAPESWISYVDAGIIEGIQIGGALALGKTLGTAGNPGAQLWADFLRGMRDGTLRDRSDHDAAWSRAEQASTDYGVLKANAKFRSTRREQNWFFMSQLFRKIMRSRPKGVSRFFPWTPAASLWALTDWLTDVTNIKPGDCMSQIAWFAAGKFDGPPSPDDFKESSEIVKELFVCFTADRGGR